MTLEQTLTADLEAVKSIIASLVMLHPQREAVAATAHAALTRHETTLLYTPNQMTDAQIHRMRETLTHLLP